MLNKTSPAFIPFVVAGHPNLDLSKKIIDALAEEGADLLELGVPFSDAVADGPTIQEASEETSQKISIDDVFNLARRCKAKHPGLQLVLFSYYNPIYKMGLRRFADQAKSAGIDASLVVDLPPEEAVTYREILSEVGLKTVFLASPTTSAERARLIDGASTGFIYYVSRTGVTGERENLSNSLEQELTSLKKNVRSPIAVGFGISTPEQAREVAKYANGVVVGSAFVKIAGERRPEEFILSDIRELARKISKAVHS
jgi:tryptophan synthase alpha chain